MNTAVETETLKQIEALQQSGQDPFGDDEFDAPKDAAQESAADVSDADNPDADKAADEDATDKGGIKDDSANDAQDDGKQAEDEGFDEQSLRDIIDPQQAPIARYNAEIPKDHQHRRAELVKEKAELLKKLMDGDLDSDAYVAEELRISTALDDLTAQRIRAETLLEANQQQQQHEQAQAIQSLIRRAKSTIDYVTDAKAQRQFDAALSVILAGNEGEDSYVEMVEQAHRMVLSARGITQQADVKPTAAPPRKPDGQVPVTLRGIPAAATPNANGDIMDQIGRLAGQEYEDAFARLSPAQRARLLDED